MEITLSIDINAPKAKVWQAIVDIERSAEMISAIKSLTVLEKPNRSFVGFKWRETREMFGKEADETMWITDCFSEEYYLTRAENHGAIYITKMAVEKITDDSTQLTMRFTATANSLMIKLVSAVMGLFMKKSMEKMLRKDLTDIKLFIETEPITETTTVTELEKPIATTKKESVCI